MHNKTSQRIHDKDKTRPHATLLFYQMDVIIIIKWGERTGDMKDFLLNWNFKKQLVAEIICYGAVAGIGNTLLWRRRPVKKKTKDPRQLICQMPKKQKYFNGIVAGCFIADLTASYFLLAHIKNKLR